MTNEEAIEKVKDMRDFIIREHAPNDVWVSHMNEAIEVLSERRYSKIVYQTKIKELENAIAKCEQAEKEFKSRTCKFKSPTNCDFCSFHSDCNEHWKEGDKNGR